MRPEPTRLRHNIKKPGPRTALAPSQQWDGVGKGPDDPTDRPGPEVLLRVAVGDAALDAGQKLDVGQYILVGVGKWRFGGS